MSSKTDAIRTVVLYTLAAIGVFAVVVIVISAIWKDIAWCANDDCSVLGWLTPVASAAAAIVAMVAIYASLMLGQRTAQASARQLRAYVFVKTATFDPTTQELQIHFVNYGATPAANLMLTSHCWLQSNPAHKEPTSFGHSGGHLGTGHTFRSTSTAELSKEQLDRLLRGDDTLFHEGVIAYGDVFAGVNETKFCREFKTDGSEEIDKVMGITGNNEFT